MSKGEGSFPGLDKVKQEFENLKKAQTGNPETPFARVPAYSGEFDNGLNKQLNYLQNVINVYDSASAFFSRDNVGLPGTALFFKIAGQMERNDMYKTIDFLVKRGAHPTLGETAAPPSDWSMGKEMSDVLGAFMKALAITKVGAQCLSELSKVACKDGDALAMEFIDCCISACAEKVQCMSHWVAHLKVVQDNKHAIKEFDRCLPFEIETLAEAAGIEAKIPARMQIGTIYRAKKLETEELEQRWTMRQRHEFKRVI